MSTATVYSWKEVENEQLNPLLSRQFITGDQAMLSRIVLTKGCFVPSHSHHNEQLAFILQGALRFVMGDGTTHIVRSGEIIVIPGNLAHSAEALEDTINFDIFAPPRQDWIDKDDSYLR
jgi:quercetin dioxygenase-like cupin family protein